jgi:ABC-2 type transport system ATP-binding protein
MEATSEIKGLCRRFDATVALDGMSFTVAPGEVTGFAGLNGAGKSTTMRAMASSFSAPASGTAATAQ